jgi:hypothetical protein
MKSCTFYSALFGTRGSKLRLRSPVLSKSIPYPVVTSGEAQECHLDPDDAREEVQVTFVDLTSLLNWTKEDEMLCPLIPLFLVRGEYTGDRTRGIKFSTCPPFRAT